MTESTNLSIEQLAEDYAASPVPDNIRISGLRVSTVNSALACALPGIMTGALVGEALGFLAALQAFVIAALILSMVGFITGYVGVKHRISSYMLIRRAFGTGGAALVNASVAISMFGWFAVNVLFFGEGAAQMIGELEAEQPPMGFLFAIGGLLMAAAAIFGFRWLQKLSMVIFPAQLLILGFVAVFVCTNISWSELVGTSGSHTLTMSEAVSAVIGSFIVSALVMPDFTRFCTTTQDAATASLIPFGLVATLVYMLSAAAAISLGSVETSTILLASGFGLFALTYIIFASVITNAVNLYGCALSVVAINPNIKEWQVIAVAGAAGSALALFNTNDGFIDFIFSLGVIFTPIGVIYVLHHFLALRHLNAVHHYPAFLAWLFGSVIGYSLEFMGASLTGVAAADAALLTAGGFLGLTQLARWR